MSQREVRHADESKDLERETLKSQGPPCPKILQPKDESTEDVRELNISSSPHNNSGNQLTLTTIVTIVIPEGDESLQLDDHASYRTNPITFEDFFSKSKIQRRFIRNVLTFQLIVNFSGVFFSFFSTVITDQTWFYEAEDDLLNALLLHTVILSTLMLFFPLLTYKLRKHHPGIVTKCILEALVRVYQASLFTFWFAFALGKIWKSKYDMDRHGLALLDDFQKNRPVFFSPVFYYFLTILNGGVIIGFLRLTQMQPHHKNAFLISFGLVGVLMILTLPLLLLTSKIGRGFVTWEIGQILGAGIFSVIDGSLTFCSFRNHGSKQKKNLPS